MLRSAPFWYRNFPRLTHTIRRLAGANYEREMELLDILCDRARIGIDVGAKVGMYTYRIRDRSSKVIAFEPIPIFTRMLAKVFDGPRGKVYPYALSNRHGTATLRIPWQEGEKGQWGRSSIDPANPLVHAQIQRLEEIEVETRTLDELDVGDVGFIKIDVEGHELAVLEGAERTIEKHRPNLLIECNDDHQPDGTGKLARWLAAHDYEAHFLLDKDVVPIGDWRYDVHWQLHGVENFICHHRSRELLPALQEGARRPHKAFESRARAPAKTSAS